MTTVFKGYATPATGSETGTWGQTLNTDVFAIVDRNLGGITTKSLSSSNVTLTSEESQTALLRLTGTLTANVQITTECLGFFLVENLTTGNFTVTIRNNLVATAATVARGMRTIVTSDATNGCRIGTKAFETGTKMAFYMAAAPVGWTKDTTAALDNAAIRLVTGSGGVTGGSANFTDTFTSRTIAQANLPNVTLTGTTNTTGNHNHVYSGQWTSENNDGTSSAFRPMRDGSGSFGNFSTASGTADTIEFAGDHSHTVSVSLGGSAAPLNFAVKYADFIICTAD